MAEPTITCPKCQSEIKLTDSLAAPIVEATRKEFDKKLADKDKDIVSREKAVKKQQEELDRAKESIDEQVADKVKTERAAIVAEEAKKARLALSTDLEQKANEIAELEKLVADKNAKLTDAQKAQAELIRKTRELDDAKRELTTDMHRAGMTHLDLTYMTGHATRDILNEYVGLDPVTAMGKYFTSIATLLAAIARRARELGIVDSDQKGSAA